MKKLTPQQKKKIEKFVVILTLMFLLSIAIVCIFSIGSSDSDEPKSSSGINTTFPDPAKKEIAENKMKAEVPQKEDKPEFIERIKMSMSAVVESRSEETKSTSRQEPENPEVAKVEVQQSVKQFYNRPKVDHEKQRMQKEIDELKAQINRQPTEVTLDEQMALIEKSYEMAARLQNTPEPPTQKGRHEEPKRVQSVEQTQSEVISSLSAMSNRGFNTAVSSAQTQERNTISACIHADQTITNSGTIKIRLLERVSIDGHTLEKGALFTGVGRITNERLMVTINTVENQGMLLRVELKVVDSDGQMGIYVPNSTEVSAIKEIAANMGSTIGSAVSFSTRSAGAEILADLGEGAIQGVSSYAQKKVQEVKVHLKSGYKIMLYEDN